MRLQGGGRTTNIEDRCRSRAPKLLGGGVGTMDVWAEIFAAQERGYVLAQEIGHHVQNVLGISSQVHQMKQQLSQAEGDALSVRLEFQVDCLARVWANRADKAWNVLKTGDVDEVMNAASAIGDDTLQRQSHGTVVPEPFMHGTSEQRQRLFRQGLNSGNPDACNTFGVDRI